MAAKPKLTSDQMLVKGTNKKVTTILRTIRGLKALAKYKPNAAQRDKVFTAIKTELESAHAAWMNPGTASGKEGFNL